MECCKKVIYKKGSRTRVNDIAPPIQYRSQFIVSVENIIHHLADAIPKAIFIYKLLQRYNIRFLLTILGITNKWAILAILLLI